MMADVRRVLKQVLGASIFLYGVVTLVFSLLLVKSKALDEAKLKVLNRLRPSFEQLELANSRLDIESSSLRPYSRYFEKITEYIPTVAESYGLLGFCRYYEGDEKSAVELIQKSLAYNPNFFWNHFNLAMIYFEKSNYDKSIEYFQKALGSSPDLTIKALMLSKVYAPLIQGKENMPSSLAENLKEGYLITQKMIAFNSILVKDKDKQINTLQKQAIMRKLNLDESDIRLRIY